MPKAWLDQARHVQEIQQGEGEGSTVDVDLLDAAETIPHAGQIERSAVADGVAR